MTPVPSLPFNALPLKVSSSCILLRVSMRGNKLSMKALLLSVSKNDLCFKQLNNDMTLLGLIRAPPFLMTEHLLHHQPSHIKELNVL